MYLLLEVEIRRGWVEFKWVGSTQLELLKEIRSSWVEQGQTNLYINFFSDFNLISIGL
jgi:hypothetical protein